MYIYYNNRAHVKIQGRGIFLLLLLQRMLVHSTKFVCYIYIWIIYNIACSLQLVNFELVANSHNEMYMCYKRGLIVFIEQKRMH